MSYIDNVTNILQIQPDGLPTFVRLSQNENGRNLYFQLAGNEAAIPSNATVTISGTKPDGNVYSGTGSITNNVVLIPETIQMTAVAGYWDAKVKIISGGNTVATGRIRFVIDADTVEPGSVPSDSVLEGLVAQAQQYAETARTEAYGSPLTATTAAGMTDKTRVYVYTGSQSGYTAGHWYYWNGSAWTDGGIYNSTAVRTDKTLTEEDAAADAKAVGDELTSLKGDLSAFNGELLYNGSHTYSGVGNWATVTVTPQTKLAIKIYSNNTDIEVNVLLQSWTKLVTISDEDWHIIDIPSGASNKLTLTYRSSSAVSISCIIAKVSDSCIEKDIVNINADMVGLDNRVDNLEQGVRELNVDDYLKIYNITLGKNRAIRLVALAKADAVITSVGVKFDYESTDNMQFGTWRVIAYGGSSATGGLGTELHTFSGSGFQKRFDLSATIDDVNSYDYLQVFIDFVYESSTYTDDIVLDGFTIALNGIERKLYGCNTWTNSQHTSSYKWKSDLIPAYAQKEDIKALKQYPQLIVSIIDDDTNYCAPTIWGAILENNSDVKIGFACMTAYMNGASTSSGANTQMTRAQLDSFYAAGHEVYSHGWACYSVRQLTTDELAQECWKSKNWLLSNGFFRGSETLVYSGGANYDTAKHNVVRGFYKFGVNAWGGGINPDILDNPLYINRVIGDTLTLAQLKAYVDDYLPTGGLLVFGFHSYELNKDAENNVQKVKDLITYIKNAGIKIVPLERAIHSVYGLNV